MVTSHNQMIRCSGVSQLQGQNWSKSWFPTQVKKKKKKDFIFHHITCEQILHMTRADRQCFICRLCLFLCDSVSLHEHSKYLINILIANTSLTRCQIACHLFWELGCCAAVTFSNELCLNAQLKCVVPSFCPVMSVLVFLNFVDINQTLIFLVCFNLLQILHLGVASSHFSFPRCFWMLLLKADTLLCSRVLDHRNQVTLCFPQNVPD